MARRLAFLPRSCLRVRLFVYLSSFLLMVLSIASMVDDIVLPVTSLNLSAKSARSVTKSIKDGYARRVAADPSFPVKSVTEVVVAAGTQLTAEWNQRGATRLIPEIDFVIAGVLTAIAGKYYSMWCVAKTIDVSHGDGNGEESNKNEKITSAKNTASSAKGGVIHSDDDGSDKNTVIKNSKERYLGTLSVPSNAFQETMLDGLTRPKLVQRLGALVAPMYTLFRAGIIASAIGYGVTGLIINLRSLLMPGYIPATQNVNIIHACVYTGAFMAIASNLRYQILQGIIEPTVDKMLHRAPMIRGATIFGIRWANGIFGSILAIAGMRWLGLQRLK